MAQGLGFPVKLKEPDNIGYYISAQNKFISQIKLMAQSKLYSILDPNACNISSFTHKEHHKDYQLWYDSTTRKEYCQYKLYGWPNERQIDIYQFRKDQRDNMVTVHYLCPFNSQEFKQFSVFVEKISLSLLLLQRLSFLQGLCILRESLIGFEAMFRKFGYVHIDDKLIGLNGEGNVKVWMNENFAYNGVAQTHLAPKWMNEELKIKHMVCSIFSLIEDRLEKSDRFREFKKEKQLKLVNFTFMDSLTFLGHYAKIHRLLIPTALPELLKWNSLTSKKKDWVKTEERSREPLTFKKLKFSPNKRKSTSKKKPFNLFTPKEEDKTKIQNITSRIFNRSIKILSPAPSMEGNIGIRPRNRSQATMSVAQSRARTTMIVPKPNKYNTKYFCEKSARTRVQSVHKDHPTLQSSRISRDLSMRENNHLKFGLKNPMEEFQFSQVQTEKTKPSHKKRKFSAADGMTFHAITPHNKMKQKIALTLAKSLVMKNALESSSRLEQHNPQSGLKIQTQPSRSNLDVPDEALDEEKVSLILPVKQQLQDREVAYKINKPFLNYKAIKNSLISNHRLQLPKVPTSPPSLRTQMLNNMEMKSSQIIMEKSSQYASNTGKMLTIKQSDIQTPMSDSNNEDVFSNSSNHFNVFVSQAEKKRSGETHITSSSKSSYHSERKEGGLMSYGSPMSTVKSGMFKSIFIGEVKDEIKEVVEGQLEEYKEES